jgi:hypothetical protein
LIKANRSGVSFVILQNCDVGAEFLRKYALKLDQTPQQPLGLIGCSALNQAELKNNSRVSDTNQ